MKFIVILLLSLPSLAWSQKNYTDSLERLAYANVRKIRSSVDTIVTIPPYQFNDVWKEPAIGFNVKLDFDAAHSLVRARIFYRTADSICFFYFNKGNFLFREALWPNQDLIRNYDLSWGMVPPREQRLARHLMEDEAKRQSKK